MNEDMRKRWRDGANQSAMYYARKKRRARASQDELTTREAYDGPIGSWSANSGGVARDTASMTNLTVVGGVTSGIDPIPAALGDWTVETLDSSVFNGSSGYLTSEETVIAFNFGVGDFAVNWWMNPAGTWGSSGTMGLIGQKEADANGGFQIYQDSGALGHLRMRMAGTGGANATDITTTGTVSKGQWTMATFVREGGVCFWYLNGALDSEATPSPIVNIIADASPVFNIGYGQTWIAYYSGALWNVGIWNRALELEDIALLYTSPPLNADAQTSTP